MTTPTRPALRWFGGKWRLGPWIVANLPPHDAYVESYGGAASVLLRKPPAKLETFNDLHGRLVNFFRVLRDQPDALLAKLDLTPYAREEYDLAHHEDLDPVEDARRFVILSGQGRVGAAGTFKANRRTSGWRYTVDPYSRTGASVPVEFSDLSHLRGVVARLKRVQIEHDHALTVIGRYDRPGVLHYVDPPYWDPTADLHSRYAHPMTEADHTALAEVLRACQGMVVLSGRPSLLYDDLYRGWLRLDRLSLTDAGEQGAEALWFNPAASANRPQPNLFDLPVQGGPDECATAR
jgi:DNA adenine methylase